MKPFWFAFNAADWLSSKSVRMMSLMERGAYIGLLATAWGEDAPGTLPADEDEVRRLAEMSPEQWAASGPRLLKEFPLVEAGTHRHNPRLLEEYAKQQAISEKNAAKGRLSAERRAATKRQPTGNSGSTAVAKNPTAVEKTATESQPITITTTLPSDDGSAGEPSSSVVLTAEVVNPEELAGRPAAAPDPAKAAARAADGSDEQHWSEGPLTKPDAFRVICERLGFEKIDFEHYRKQALVAAEDASVSRTIGQWVSWVRNYFNNQLKNGPLLKPTDGEATRTGVHAPQHPDAYKHEVRPELQAERDAEQERVTAARIAANFQKTAAAMGQTTQPLPGVVARTP